MFSKLRQLLPSWQILKVSETEIEGVARLVVEHCMAGLAKRLSSEVASMSPSQRQGYVRARARHPVARYVTVMSRGNPRYDSSAQQRIVARGLVQVADQMLRQLQPTEATVSVRLSPPTATNAEPQRRAA